VRLDFCSEEVRWHSYCHPVAVRHGYHHGRMTRVISSQGVVFVFLLTVHGHFHHVDGASSVLGDPVALRLA
jgi:hypothetical protein